MAVSYDPAGTTGRWDGIWDWVQMLSGGALILFIWCHSIFESTLIVSPKILDSIGYFFEATYLVYVIGPLVFLTLLGHFILAARKMPSRFESQTVFWKHVTMQPHLDTWLWLVQTVSAMIILVMASIHMWVALNDLPILAVKSAARVQSSGWAIFFVILLLMTHMHVGIGLYRIAVKWGFVGDKKRSRFKRNVAFLSGGFIVLGVVTLCRYLLLSVTQ